jgi:DNA polymerase (family X)
MEMTNAEIADLLHSVAAGLTLKKANMFQVRAYENAATSIEHLTADLKDIWREGKLDDVPGVGKGLQEHLDELFRTGSSKHFDSILKKYPPVLFEMLKIPGVGPRTALELTDLGVKSLPELEKQLKNGSLVKKGLSAKVAEKLLLSLQEQPSDEGRMLLPIAFEFAEQVLDYLKKGPGVKVDDPLGSLRRRVATIGDLDFAASATDPKAVIEYFIKMPEVSRVVSQGDNNATVMLKNGLHVDLLVGKPESYGALLQHFTGSKQHNIHLRTLSEKKGLSLSEDGVKKVTRGKKQDTNNIILCKTEDEIYRLLGMQTPPPEIREDTGEIEAAIAHKLPKLIEYGSLIGDLHTHCNYPLDHPSHGPGIDSPEAMVKEAERLGYTFIGISDHPPAPGKHSPSEIVEIVKKRTKVIQKIAQGKKSVHVLNGLEIDILPNGKLSVPDEALKTLDYCIAGIHSGHRQTSKGDMTKRILSALENPYVDIISHPTGRLLNRRPSFDADWDKIFEYCAKHNKLLEINAYPDRLDLRDDLVRQALKFGVKFIIDSDAHAADQMDHLDFGVSVARRGWATKKDIVNAWEWKKIAEWFDLK